MIVLLTIAFGLFVRLYRLTDLFYFTHDEETIAWRVMPWVRDNNPFLLGGVTPFHIHLGPWFYYLSALILKLSRFNPLGWGIATAIFSLVTMWLIFFAGKLFFNRRVGLIALLLYATSFLMIAFDRHWWPLYFGPLLSLIIFICLYRLIKGKSGFVIPLSLALAFGFHTDPSNWALLLLSAITWVKFKLKVNKQHLLIGILILLISFTPLILFDLFHSGINLRGINQYLSETVPHQQWSFNRLIWVLSYIPRSLSRLLYPGTSDLAQSYAYCRQFAHSRLEHIPLFWFTFTILVLVSFLYLALRWRHKISYWLFSAYLLLIILGLNLYGNFFSSDLFDHYLTTLFPLFFLILAVLIDKIKPLRLIGPLGIILINLYFFSYISTQDSYKAKHQAVNWGIQQIGDQSFALDSSSSCFRYNGSRYLFMLSGKEPVQSFVDTNFSWLYKQPLPAQLPKKIIILRHYDSPDPIPDNITANQTFGSWQIFILDTLSPMRQLSP